MKLILIGATGIIGRAVADALSQRHEVVAVTRRSEPLKADLVQPASIRALFDAVGPVDGVVCVAGSASFKPLAQLADEDFAASLSNKLMGQVNLVREALARVRDGGVVVVTSGVLARAPIPGSAAISLVNAGLEGFTRAAALEAPRGIRVNVVSPPWVDETLQALGMTGVPGLPAAVVARAYLQSVTGTQTGAVIEPTA